MPDRPWKDEFTLLCERCGYVIEGLDPGGACPECGKAISESLPERRVGTAWQRRKTFRSLLVTWWQTVRHPIRTLDTLRFDTAQDIALAGWACAPWLILWPVVMMLTWIEARGIRYFGIRRGYRITTRIAWSVCGHGAVGWAIVGVGLWLSVVLVGMGVGRSLDYYTDQYYDPLSASRLVGLGIGLGGPTMLAGFLFFEVFAWLGLRRCRFANRVRPEKASPERE